MKKITFALICICLNGSLSHAAAPSPVEFGNKIAIKIKDVALSENAKVTLGANSTSIKRVGSGLRYKKIAFITANVYVGQLFSNGKVDQTSLSTLKDSVIKNLPAVMTLTFLRDVGADKLSNGFKETLSENGVKIDQAPYSAFLEAVKTAGEMKEGESYQLLFGSNSFSFSAHGNEFYHLENASNEVLGSFMMIWFGKAPDSGLESFQKDLLKP